MKLSNVGWILAGVLAIILVILLVKDCKGPNDVPLTQGDSLTYWKNKVGEVASLKKKEADFYSQERKGYLDSIAKLHNTKTKFIREVVTVTQKGEVRIVNTEIPIVRYVDSNNCPRILYQGFESPWYLVEAQIDVKGDSSFVRLETIDTLSVVWHEVKEGNVFNRKNYLQLDIQNANPYNHITNVTAYRVPLPKPKKFGIGPQVGVTYDGNFRPTVGLGLSYNIIRF